MKFAPLIRVSTEKQERQGESLSTQRKQLENAITALNGTIYKWYSGQESATAEHERKILEQLMKDAVAHKFDAVMVADPSRWSRDNIKSATDLAVLKQHGIRFFVGSTEYDLYDNGAVLYLGMNAIMNQFFAREQAKKSIQNRIERAKRIVPSKGGKLQCGNLPFGRRFNDDGVLEVIPEDKKKVTEMAHLYINNNVSFPQLGERYHMNSATIWNILTTRCGDTWEQRFQNKTAGIDETVTITIPRLLPESTIQAIKSRCKARRSWEHGQYKHPYLLSRLIFDSESGYALTGTTWRKRLRYYRTFRGSKQHYQVNADVLEPAIEEALYEVLSDNDLIYHAVFDGEKEQNLEEDLRKKRSQKQKEYAIVQTKLDRFVDAIGNYGGPDIHTFLGKLKSEIKKTEDKLKELETEIKLIDVQLQSIPTKKEILTAREKLRQGLMKSMEMSEFMTGASFRSLPFEDKRSLFKLLFGGMDESGKKYGIYVTPIDENPKRYEFVAHGRIGSVQGSITNRNGDADASDIYGSKNKEVAKSVADIVKRTNITNQSIFSSQIRREEQN
jgi:DNA invertase Pin-like site-specific DNA recombinase